ncbi:alpha-galactosidase [Candidatus Halobonum tyrrellensis]|uniref:Alpha-galactosidase n=1 Tax=Candidatus Halobonum tyrrellensis G22 TaxID=1324957 RepID=V4H8J6_9EURY|nr:alpha-galactosidase [Candidatus Halobonum tyrrellensis]ESP87040.1 alpha-galactosidase [Candidatus Halobonum tyrrellensis G22]
MPKIAFVGAGSIVFARNLMGDILSFPELRGSTLALMDVDEERLDRTVAAADAMVAENDVDATIEPTTDRRAALDGADYVINTIHVGGREPFENEIRIPQEYGVNQAVGDTLGPGGVFRAMRTAPVMLDIARDMEELCPDALLLNYTNPMAMLCWAVDEATDIDVVGLCHSVQHTAEAISNYVGVPKEDLEYTVAGINHVAWFLEAEHGGKSVYPALYEAMDDPETYSRDNVRFEILRHFDAFVTESSNHMSEYVPYFRTDEATIEEYVVEADHDDYFVDWMPTGRYFEHWCEYQEEAREMDPSEIDPEIERSEEYGSRVIHSMETGERRRMNLNVRNSEGAVSNLGSDACVEVPCLVDDRGVTPCAVGDLPPQLAAIDRSNVDVQRLAVTAALDHDQRALRQAVKLDPLTAAACTLDEIDAMVDDLLEANADYLPDELVGRAAEATAGR